MELEENERIDDLEFSGLKIIQNTNQFCFGIDSVLLSDFVKEVKEGCIIMDLGTGNGILTVLLSAKTNAKKIIGIEKQLEVTKLAKRNVKLNQLEDKVDIFHIDVNEVPGNFQKDSVDVIVTNPPYKIKGTGKVNDLDHKMVARHETTATLEDFIKISFQMLKDHGSIYMVHKADRIVDILFFMRKYRLEPKKIRFVHSYKGKAPELVLIKGTKNARPYVEIEDPLYIYHKDGSYTEEILEIYHK